MKKNKHIGNVYVTDAGFTLRVTEWKNRYDVTVEVVETGERIHTDFFALRDGAVRPNLYKYPPKGECTITQAIALTIGFMVLAAGALAYLITYIASL